MIIELIRYGRRYLEQGQLVRAGEVCQQISAYLEFYLVSEEDWALVDHFLKEVLLMRKLARWKERGSPEYQHLEQLYEEFSKNSSNLSQMDIETLEKYLSMT